MKLARALLCGSALLHALSLSACSNQDDEPGNSTGHAGASGNGGNPGLGGQPSEIAQWPVPNSPSLALPNPQSYDATTTPGVVHDSITGLDWLQDPGSDLYSRADALAVCDALSFAGFEDWRVPSFIELASLFDVVPNDENPLEPIYLSPTFHARGRFWTASAVSSSGLGRLVDFTADGCSATMACSIGVAANAEDELGGAFCVRKSEAWPTSARYEISANQVKDLRTGLTWLSVPASVQTGDHAHALKACAALEDGARLPSVNELLSLLVPVLDSKTFPDWPVDAFAWSDSAVSAQEGSYWIAAIGGATRADAAENHNRVECVR